MRTVSVYLFGVSPNTHHSGTGSILDRGRTDVCTQRLRRRFVQFLTVKKKTNHIITVSPTLYIIYIHIFDHNLLKFCTVDTTAYGCLL